MTIASACSSACPTHPRQGGHDRPSSRHAAAFDKAPSVARVFDEVTRVPRDPHGRFVRRRAFRSSPLAQRRSSRSSRPPCRRPLSRAEARSMQHWPVGRRAYPASRRPEGTRSWASARHALPGRSRRVRARHPRCGRSRPRLQLASGRCGVSAHRSARVHPHRLPGPSREAPSSRRGPKPASRLPARLSNRWWLVLGLSSHRVSAGARPTRGSDAHHAAVS